MNDQDKQQIEHDVRVSLFDHFNAILKEQNKRLEQAFTTSREAVIVANEANEKRLNLLNEFRQQSQDEQARFALKATLEVETRERDRRFERIEQSIHKLESSIARMYGGLAVLAFIGIAALVRVFWTG